VDDEEYEEISQQVLLLDHYLVVRENIEDDKINDFIAYTSSYS
jgi:hypothetical protein